MEHEKNRKAIKDLWTRELKKMVSHSSLFDQNISTFEKYKPFLISVCSAELIYIQVTSGRAQPLYNNPFCN